MKAFFKTLLYRVLGQRNFINFLYRSYLTSYNLGLLKNDYVYKYHYYVKRIIKPGDIVLDIGANVGYYTYLFQQWVGNEGRVYAVEPVPQFNAMLKKNHGKHKNVTIFPYALGTEEKSVELIVPGNQKYLRTGLAHIDDGDENVGFRFKAEMKRASDLFKNIERIDYIKIDIEGYETIVLPEMKSILEKHLPIIQAETYGEQRNEINTFLRGLGYEPFELENGKLIESGKTAEATMGDVLYLTKQHQAAVLA